MFLRFRRVGGHSWRTMHWVQLLTTKVQMRVWTTQQSLHYRTAVIRFEVWNNEHTHAVCTERLTRQWSNCCHCVYHGLHHLPNMVSQINQTDNLMLWCILRIILQLTQEWNTVLQPSIFITLVLRSFTYRHTENNNLTHKQLSLTYSLTSRALRGSIRYIGQRQLSIVEDANFENTQTFHKWKEHHCKIVETYRKRA